MTRKKLEAGAMKALAKGLGVSANTVRTYIDKHEMPVTVPEAKEWYRRHKEKSGTRSAIGETARLRRAQADVAEIEARRLAGRIVDVTDVEAVVSQILAIVRAEVRALPPRVASVVARMTDEAEIQRYVGTECDGALRKAQGALEAWADQEIEAQVRAAGAPSGEDGRPVG